MPLLSDTMTEGKIVSWNKAVGATVKADDVLADVETDKATMEVVGYEEGTLLYIGVEAGKAAKINEIIAIVGKPGTDVSAYVDAEKAGGSAPVAARLRNLRRYRKPRCRKRNRETRNRKFRPKITKNQSLSPGQKIGRR
jgi:pyruvate/2-oxoglutarate dehydrogenase complex dihydrolipoamide acyltransferase (E2) component